MPGLIPASELAGLIATAESSFDQSVTLQRNTPSQDILGNDLESYASVGTLACRIGPPNAKHVAAFQAIIGTVPMWIVTYSLSADVRAGDHLVNGADTLHVHVLLKPKGYSTARQAICGELV